MTDSEQSCGQELAASAPVPEKVSALFRHVAVNLRAHAAWVGVEGAECRREHDAMLEAAEAYEAISTAARRAGNLLRTLDTLPAAPHEPRMFDREAFAAWMATKVRLQRELAAMLLEHAAESEAAAATALSRASAGDSE